MNSKSLIKSFLFLKNPQAADSTATRQPESANFHVLTSPATIQPDDPTDLGLLSSQNRVETTVASTSAKPAGDNSAESTSNLALPSLPNPTPAIQLTLPLLPPPSCLPPEQAQLPLHALNPDREQPTPLSSQGNTHVQTESRSRTNGAGDQQWIQPLFSQPRELCFLRGILPPDPRRGADHLPLQERPVPPLAAGGDLLPETEPEPEQHLQRAGRHSHAGLQPASPSFRSSNGSGGSGD